MDNLTFVNGKDLVKQEKGQYMSSPVFILQTNYAWIYALHRLVRVCKRPHHGTKKWPMNELSQSSLLFLNSYL